VEARRAGARAEGEDGDERRRRKAYLLGGLRGEIGPGEAVERGGKPDCRAADTMRLNLSSER